MAINRIAMLGMLGLAALATTAPAQATVFDFDISSAQDTASGQFTLSDDPMSPNSVIGVTGQVDGVAITGLSGYGLSSNLLFPSGTELVDRAGLAFTVASGLSYNIFNNTNSATTYSFCSSAFNSGCTGGDADRAPAATFSVSTGTTSAVPEPATWAMLIGGFALVSGSMRRRTMTVRFA